MPRNNLSYAELEEENRSLKGQIEVLRESGLSADQSKAEYLINIFNSMGDPVFVKDHESRLILVNDSFCTLFQLKREQIIGKTLAENVPPEEREDFLSIDHQVIDTGVENIQEEPLTLDSGSTRTISTRKTRFIDSDGNKFLIGIIRDLTERKKAEDELKASEPELRQIIDQKNKILSIIAHDLKSPISTIMSFSDYMHDEISKTKNKEFESYCTLINTSAKNAHILLDNLLAWARSSTGKNQFNPEEIELATILQKNLVEAKSGALIKSITLQLLPSDDIYLISDRNMLSAVLRNLIHNAIKFTNPEGLVTIKSESKGDHVEITVSDNGIGMSEESLQKLFSSSINVSKYGTANEKGSGLGLNLCKDFVNKMGGKIWVKSELGKGSEFTFSLPLSQNNFNTV